MADTGIVTGLLAAPLLGVVTEEDADSAVVIDMARNILGNPYGDELGGPPDALPAGEEDAGSGEPQSPEPGDGGGRWCPTTPTRAFPTRRPRSRQPDGARKRRSRKRRTTWARRDQTTEVQIENARR